jgi:hypothetical protein
VAPNAEVEKPRARLIGRALNSIPGLAFRDDRNGSFALSDRRLALAGATSKSNGKNDRAQDYEDLFHNATPGDLSLTVRILLSRGGLN